jgi:hypothetical protein
MLTSIRPLFFLVWHKKSEIILQTQPKGESPMTRFLGVLVIVVAIVACLGYFLGWFTFSSDNTDGKTHITVNVDKDKIKETGKKIGDTVEGAVDKIKEGVQTRETKTTTPP